ncbi:alpha/beta hydrolase [Streptomyces albofaciens JCM 4342]|uniref:alpha/beta hydrolase n=1 Tax=Streptomyces albofaciens TaxID=66866 RepID=UPI00123BFBC7|nr:alpha/beta fold hydrolase [Streptomyces albofaciens]KAA6221470.1 alpha/beta hydrolase [Streptomyces albofaciens JCM 4342]
MRKSKRRRPVGACAVATAAVLATALPFLAPPGAAASAAPDRPRTTLDWQPCGSTPAKAASQQCATLKVPLDYKDPGGRQIDLAVSRIPAEDPAARRGALLLIPGGPGGTGLDRPATAKLSERLRAAYDIIGFDPRGMGHSSPVSCGLPYADLAMTTLRPWPAADGSIDGNVAAARRTAAACARNGGPVLRGISTANEARDIDRIRQALGEHRLSGLGVSYGAYTGAVYAQLFPDRTAHWVLDSNGDPDPARVERGWLANSAVGAEDRFPDFAARAADPARADRLADRPEEIRPLFLDLAARLDRTPLPWPDANPAELNGNVLRQQLLTSLHSDSRLDGLITLMRAARAKLDDPKAPDLPAQPVPSPADIEAQQQTAAVSTATLCNDVAWPRSPGKHARDVAADRVRHPLTAGMPVNITPCSFWPAPPAERPVRITPHGPSNVLLIQNRRDPNTPLAGARAMRRAFGDRARMITVEAGGHGVYKGDDRTCADARTTAFLLTGARPATDITCPATRA